METTKSHSWWWNSHVSSRNSKWLSENLQDIDRLVNEMLKLIEEDGDSFAKKAQMYYQRRPVLISHVEEFYRMYRALAGRYNHVISDLTKNIPTELQFQSSVNGSDISTEVASISSLSSPERSSENKLGHLKPSWSSDHSKKGFDETSSESGSESDSAKAIGDCENSTKFEARIAGLEHELCEARNKLHEYKVGHKDNLDFSSKTSSLDNQTVVIHTNLTDLAKKLESLQADLPGHEEEIESILAAMHAFVHHLEIKISHRDDAIRDYRVWFGSVLNKSMLDNYSLDAAIAEEKLEDELFSKKSTMKVDEMIKELKAMVEKSSNLLRQEKIFLEAKISNLKASNSSYESKILFFEGRVKQLEAEKRGEFTESQKCISELNRNLEEFKKKVIILTSEKDELNAQVIKLIEDTECWDDESRKIDEQLQELQLEHEKLTHEIEDARRASSELMNRVRELEEMVEKQREVIFDCAEGKREAIKHLCSSLEHYRDGYQQLRQALQMKKILDLK